MITSHELMQLWSDLGLLPDLYCSIMLVGGLSEQIEWLRFLALACSALGVVSDQLVVARFITYLKSVFFFFILKK